MLSSLNRLFEALYTNWGTIKKANLKEKPERCMPFSRLRSSFLKPAGIEEGRKGCFGYDLGANGRK